MNGFDTLNGLPLHPLVVHLVVVLLPLCALGALVIAFVPRWSLRFGVLVWVGALVSIGAAFVAEQSGQALAARVGMPAVHAQLGEQVKFYAAALFVVTFVLWLLDQRIAPRTLLMKIIAGLVVVAAVAAMWATFRAGDSGSRAVWQVVIR